MTYFDLLIFGPRNDKRIACVKAMRALTNLRDLQKGRAGLVEAKQALDAAERGEIVFIGGIPGKYYDVIQQILDENDIAGAVALPGFQHIGGVIPIHYL